MQHATVATFDEMEPLYDGVARRARATLGVTAFGMQLMELPPHWDGYPLHDHGPAASDAGQEEVYVPLTGSAVMTLGDERIGLAPGMMVRVAPELPRRIVPGPDGIRFLALGGRPGAFTPPAWTELGGPWPVPPEQA